MARKRISIYRAIIDQPSTLQELHHLHGTPVLVKDGHVRPVVQVYFFTGPTLSMEVFRNQITKVFG